MLIKELHPLSRSFFVVAGENTIQYTHHVPEITARQLPGGDF
jgi:peroxiredoxin